MNALENEFRELNATLRANQATGGPKPEDSRTYSLAQHLARAIGCDLDTNVVDGILSDIELLLQLAEGSLSGGVIGEVVPLEAILRSIKKLRVARELLALVPSDAFEVIREAPKAEPVAKAKKTKKARAPYARE